MNQPATPLGKAPLSDRDLAASRPDPSPPQGPQHRVVVHHYRRMKPRRVYPLRVELLSLDRQAATAGTASVVVRPFIPGAQVTPSEREVLATAGGQALFYVTPLAKGWLRDARLEVRREGRLLQVVPLVMKGTTQTLTWILLALAFLIPALLVISTQYFDLSGHGPEPVRNARRGQQIDSRNAPGQRVPDRMPRADEPVRPAGPLIGGATGLPGQGGAGAAADGASDQNRSRPKGPLADVITRNVPNIPYVTDNVAEEVQFSYGMAQLLAGDHLSFYLCLLLLGATTISWVTHRSQRARRRGPPLGLVSAVPLEPDAETMTIVVPTDGATIKPAR